MDTSCVNVRGTHPLGKNYEVAVALCKISNTQIWVRVGLLHCHCMTSVEFISYQVHQICVCTSCTFWGDKHALWSDPSIAFSNFQSRPSHQDFPETLRCLGNMNQSLEFLWVPYVQDSLQIVTNYVKVCRTLPFWHHDSPEVRQRMSHAMVDLGMIFTTCLCTRWALKTRLCHDPSKSRWKSFYTSQVVKVISQTNDNELRIQLSWTSSAQA